MKIIVYMVLKDVLRGYVSFLDGTQGIRFISE